MRFRRQGKGEAARGAVLGLSVIPWQFFRFVSAVFCSPIRCIAERGSLRDVGWGSYTIQIGLVAFVSLF